PAYHLGAGTDLQPEAHLGMALAKGREQVRGQILDAAGYRQAQLTMQGALEGLELHIEDIQPVEHIRAGRQQQIRRLGQIQLATDKLDQRLACQLFKLENLKADRRLGKGHLLGGTAVGQGAAQGTKNMQLTPGYAMLFLAHGYAPVMDSGRH